MFDTASITMDYDEELGFIERRQGQRHLSVFRIARLSWGKRDALCLVRNISADGAMIECSEGPGSGAAVTLEIRTDKRMSARIRWTRDGTAGLHFYEPIDVERLLREERNPLLRARPRAPRFVRPGHVRLSKADQLLGGRLVNISVTGLCVDLKHAALHLGDEVVAAVENLGSVHGAIRWARAGLFGVQLTRPLAYDPFRAWLAKQSP